MPTTPSSRSAKKPDRPKLTPIPENGNDWDGYRGDLTVIWRLAKAHVEEYATTCRCGQWWGWSWDLKQIQKVRDAMAKHGCPKCRKKEKAKKKAA